MHPHSCELNALKKWWVVFVMAYKFYVPIHGLPCVIYKRKLMMKEPVTVIKNLIKNIIKSSLFLSLYVSVFWYFCCVLKNIRRKTDIWNVLISGFICSFSCLFEPSNRRQELALYMFPRFLETAFLMLVKRGYLKSIENGEVLVFSFAMSFIMYCYQNEERNIKPTYLSMFKKYWGTN